ncbi:MAG: AAA family ATPase [Sedimentisphaerales bacterium]|jgi:transitional endoplasmic reticulum ATPase
MVEPVANKVQIPIQGRPDLDGTHEAILETDYPVMHELFEQSANQRLMLGLRKGKVCCAVDACIRYSSENILRIDRFKQKFLKVRDGENVEIQLVTLSPAQRVELVVTADYQASVDNKRLYGKPVSQGENTVLYSLSGQPRVIQIAKLHPSGLAIIGPQTEIVTKLCEDAVNNVPLTYKDVGGLDREVRIVREIVEFPLRYPEVFERLGITQPRGLILYGPPGTGKTLIVKVLASEVGAKIYTINGPEILSKFYGDSEEKLRSIFQKARETAPSVILIDELDALVPKRDSSGELERRIVATFLTLMDGLTSMRGVVVIGTTNRVNAIDSALRREGRFGQEVRIGAPDVRGRKQIMEIYCRRMPLSGDVSIELLAERTVGFVGSDLVSLCREAAYCALRRSSPLDGTADIKVPHYDDLRVTQADFEAALAGAHPSAIREFLVELPKVSWGQIGGLQEVKRLLTENLTFAVTKRDVFRKAGIKPPRGILLYGPPGTGKTLLAKAVAHECGANFIAIRGPEIRSKWFGESEERIRNIFAKAREVAPCIIFFDEIDAVAPMRGNESTPHTDPIVNQILVEMDGIEASEGVFVLGATNRPGMLDPAILRSGRFDYQIEVPLPDSAARASIFHVHLAEKPLADDIDQQELVRRTEGFSGADIAAVCREAAMIAAREKHFESDGLQITMAHFCKAIQDTAKSTEDLRPRPFGFVTGTTKGGSND